MVGTVQHLAQDGTVPPQGASSLLDGGNRALQVADRWLSSQQACAYLGFTGVGRLTSFYRFVKTHGINKHWISPRRLRFRQSQLDRALERPAAVRRRHAIEAAAVGFRHGVGSV